MKDLYVDGNLAHCSSHPRHTSRLIFSCRWRLTNPSAIFDRSGSHLDLAKLRSRCTKAAVHVCYTKGDVVPRKSMCSSLGCLAAGRPPAWNCIRCRVAGESMKRIGVRARCAAGFQPGLGPAWVLAV